MPGAPPARVLRIKRQWTIYFDTITIREHPRLGKALAKHPNCTNTRINIWTRAGKTTCLERIAQR